MTSILSRKPKSNDTIIHQFVFIEAPVGIVSEQIIQWGEAAWWPKECLWSYRRLTDGDVRVGTQYEIKINKPSAADWKAEVTQLLPCRLIERTFIKGLFNGFERIILEEKSNGTRIDYELHFKIRGPLNLILWPFVLRGQYLKTIKMILDSLKNHLIMEAERLLGGER